MDKDYEWMWSKESGDSYACVRAFVRQYAHTQVHLEARSQP